ncbi:hypothetical protein CEXT_567261 [Caerostris extrusa]|uniref:Uncharacterized protein n=1 Tax=Caerostris extrusa TaxID=172846 RepID=A0AAV4V640_CAEEX|nr:hypothetical protein CEXT_567261 [Caerostris extrusa]
MWGVADTEITHCPDCHSLPLSMSNPALCFGFPRAGFGRGIVFVTSFVWLCSSIAETSNSALLQTHWKHRHLRLLAKSRGDNLEVFECMCPDDVCLLLKPCAVFHGCDQWSCRSQSAIAQKMSN